METTTREQIINAHDNLRDCALAEWEVSQQEVQIKLEKQAAHKLTQLARQALLDIDF